MDLDLLAIQLFGRRKMADKRPVHLGFVKRVITISPPPNCAWSILTAFGPASNPTSNSAVAPSYLGSWREPRMAKAWSEVGPSDMLHEAGIDSSRILV